ncbi:MAG: HAD-IA family hydrolase [Candidatus Margulisiibacteriota bacterium]
MPDLLSIKKADTIIFDIDGTLVDTTKSYNEVIKQTVKLYLSLFIAGDVTGDDLITTGEINLFRQTGGFNNDWDTSAAVIYYYLNMIGDDLICANAEAQGLASLHKTAQSIDQILDYLKILKSNVKTQSLASLLGNKNIPEFIKLIKNQKEIGLDAVRNITSPQIEQYVFYFGDLASTNLVQRIYQEIYQGPELFSEVYGIEPLFYHQEGYYIKETLLPDKDLLIKLAEKKKLGIATGRIYAEAKMVLKRFEIMQLLKIIITDDDIAGHQRKPDPQMLFLAAEKLKGNKYIYAGDLPDDVKAANSAKDKLNIMSVAVYDENPEADYNFQSTDEFIRAILTPDT